MLHLDRIPDPDTRLFQVHFQEKKTFSSQKKLSMFSYYFSPRKKASKGIAEGIRKNVLVFLKSFTYS